MAIDDPHPQIGRIYDYVLGGTYNGEADRRAAEAMIARMPAYPRWARVLALGFTAIEEELTDEHLAVIREMSRVAHIEFFPRTVEQVTAAVAPWRVTSVERTDPPLPDELRAASPMNRWGMFGILAEHG
jgi:hypothetical protein